MTYKQVCRLCFLGIDDELKDDATSVYTTDISSSFFPVPVSIIKFSPFLFSPFCRLGTEANRQHVHGRSSED